MFDPIHNPLLKELLFIHENVIFLFHCKILVPLGAISKLICSLIRMGNLSRILSINKVKYKSQRCTVRALFLSLSYQQFWENFDQNKQA